MIPKQLADIEWADIEALIAVAREEDDSIEFKGSFKGGSDFLGLSDAKQKSAVESIAREAIAFLNARGGDIVIGVQEASNENPVASKIESLPGVAQIADRLAQSLAARIEPMQSMIGVKAVVNPDSVSGDGIILVRAGSSLRAPHRSRETRECYIRRGRESVPMPMDEIQDLTLNRLSHRADRLRMLDEQSQPLRSGSLGTIRLPDDRLHIRCAFVPLAVGELELTADILTAFLGDDPKLVLGDREMRNDVAFRGLYGNGKPILRGRRFCNVEAHDQGVSYSAKEIYQNGVMVTDFSDRWSMESRGKSYEGFALDWVIGYFANSLASMRQVLEHWPQFGDGLLRVWVHSLGSKHLVIGQTHWAQAHAIPAGTIAFPDFEIARGANFDDVFHAIQTDICALAGVEVGTPYSFASSP